MVSVPYPFIIPMTPETPSREQITSTELQSYIGPLSTRNW